MFKITTVTTAIVASMCLFINVASVNSEETAIPENSASQEKDPSPQSGVDEVASIVQSGLGALSSSLTNNVSSTPASVANSALTSISSSTAATETQKKSEEVTTHAATSATVPAGSSKSTQHNGKSEPSPTKTEPSSAGTASTKNKNGKATVSPMNSVSTTSEPTTKAEHHKNIGTLATVSSCLIILMGAVLCTYN